MADFLLTEKQRKAFFKKQAPNSGGCIEWIGSRSSDGYGRFWASGRVRGAHRVAYAVAFGTYPEAGHVLHRCDNPACVNPSHLFIGTHSDNMRDMYEKGRKPTPPQFIRSAKRNKCGDKNPHAVLAWIDVRQIRASGEENTVLAERFGVTTQNIRLIRANKTWKE